MRIACGGIFQLLSFIAIFIILTLIFRNVPVLKDGWFLLLLPAVYVSSSMLASLLVDCLSKVLDRRGK